ncbi:MAG: LPS export ABC transporter periplasmic protein LptC [Candidatus Omnitrophica bacterium]|nr:LPS export ABC transporter periplasmic protein LptC [Candidatus Omnitrophota bacterium]
MVLKSIIFLLLFSLLGGEGFVFSQQTIKGFYLSNFQSNGTKDWELKGKEAKVYQNLIEIFDMEAKYFRKDRMIDIKADKGKLNRERMCTYLEDNVKIRSSDGLSLFTNSLIWLKNANLINTQDKVVLTKGTMTIEAQGMQANTSLEKVDFKKDVKIKFSKEDAPRIITIDCKGPLEIDYKKGEAIFKSQVIVESEEGKMIADRAIVYFAKDSKSIERIVAEGNVKIYRGANVTFAQKATYLNKEKKIILEGRPRLILFPQKVSSKD